MDDPDSILLIVSRTSQDVPDIHHHTPMMQTIAVLRDKYDLHMRIERYVPAAPNHDAHDARFIHQ